MKQLPSQGKAGLSALLQPHKLYDSSFHSIGIQFRKECVDEACEQVIRRLFLSVISVFDHAFADWDLKSLFGRTLNAEHPSCPLAIKSVITVKTPDTALTYNLKEGPAPDIGMLWNGRLATTHFTKSNGLAVQRNLYGYGQERGYFRISIRNDNPTTTTVALTEMLPWFLRVYAHTVRLTTPTDSTILDMYLQTAQDRAHPMVLELSLSLAPHATTTLTMDFEKAFLKYTEHKPDANRGFDLPPAILTLEKTHMYTAPLLLSLPTPDFSMPYNVITLTCTIIALFFGNVFNLLTKHFEPLQSSKD
jgi:phosphatidylinositol glycan class T